MSPVQLLALFGAGLSSFLAPCVVPLVPAYLGMLAGESVVRPGRLVAPTLLFVAGFSSVFAVLGALAGRIGLSTGFSGAAARIGGALIVGFGVLLFAAGRGTGIREHRLLPTLPTRGGSARPIVIGVAFGAAWSPCVGPLLGAALTVAATSGSPVRGAVLLLAYALGIGAPFLVAPLVLSAWPTATRRLTRWSVRLAPIAAGGLVVLGALLVTGLYTRAVSPLVRWIPGVA